MPRTSDHTLYMLCNLRRYRHTFRAGSITMDVLSRLYPHKMLASRDVQNHSTDYSLMARLARQHYIEKVDNCHPGARYKLTLHGRCKVLCVKFGISFLCLCIISEAYALHKNQLKNNCKSCYVLQDMADMFNGIYSYKAISNAGFALCSRGLAKHISNHIIQINADFVDTFGGHQETLYELHCWIAGLQNALNRIVLDSPGAVRMINPG